jgi:hypothetical protein
VDSGSAVLYRSRHLEAQVTEALLTKKATDACEKLMKGCVVLKHADKASSGYPDTSITHLGNTLWIEFKHAAPTFKSQGIQELTCCRLELHGRCIYVIFNERQQRIDIVSPKKLGNWPNTGIHCSGFDFQWLAEQIQRRLL